MIKQRFTAKELLSDPLADYTATDEWVRAGDLKLDMSYQRPQSATKIKRMVERYRQGSLGALYVSRRAGGDLYVMDGGHRLVAAIRYANGNVEFKMRCLVYEGLTYREEALAFYHFNSERNTMQTLLRYRAAYEGGDPEVLAIAKILNELAIDYTWSPPGRKIPPNTIVCWVTLQTISRRQTMPYLAHVLRLIQDTWKGAEMALTADFVKAVDHVLRCHGKDANWDDKEFVRSNREHSPLLLLREGEQKMRRVRHIGCAEVLHGYYQKGKRSRRLDDFRQRPSVGKKWETEERAAPETDPFYLDPYYADR